jgi:hypothetical protein
MRGDLFSGECATAVNDASICCWCYITIRPSAPARCGAIDDRRNDARRQEGKGGEQADVPFAPHLPLGNLGERANAALAIAMSKASRLSGLIAGFAQGACTMPFTAAKLGAVQGSVIVVGGWQEAKLSRPWSSA